MNNDFNVGAFVVLRDGAIINWKIRLGWNATKETALFHVNLEDGDELRVSNFFSFDSARNWMKYWPIHVTFKGFRPF